VTQPHDWIYTSSRDMTRGDLPRIGIAPTEPVSSDEVIEVHNRLAKFEGSISEPLHHHSA